MQHQETIPKKFSPERLMKIRRLRKARRLFKHMPLFAYGEMCKTYPGYRYEEFLDDLRRRSKRKRRVTKSPLKRYGRFDRMQSLIRQYQATGNLCLLRQANQLRQRLSKWYQIRIQIKDTYKLYTYSPLIALITIEKLSRKVSSCQTWEEVDAVIGQFDNTPYFIH